MVKSELFVSKRGEANARITLLHNLPESVAEANEVYGESIVLELFNTMLTQRRQNNARLVYDEGEAAMQSSVDTWVPGQRASRVKKSAFDTAMGTLHNLNEEDLAELLEKVKARKKEMASHQL